MNFAAGWFRPFFFWFRCHPTKAHFMLSRLIHIQTSLSTNDRNTVDFGIISSSLIPSMAPSATSPPPASDPTILALRKTLTSESEPLARRFRALFSLKHLACQSSIPAIEAIAAAFTSPSALLKHELAYCLGQTKNLAAVPFLRAVLEDRDEDAMCRHEAAEALGAIGDTGSLGLLRELRDNREEKEVVRETCEIAVARIEWETSDAGRAETEKLKKRHDIPLREKQRHANFSVISPLSIPRPLWRIPNLSKSSR